MIRRTVKVDLDTSGDDRRIIKFAELECFETTTGLIWKKRTYVARHKETGIESINEWPWNKTVSSATADCIWNVLMRRAWPPMARGGSC